MPSGLRLGRHSSGMALLAHPQQESSAALKQQLRGRSEGVGRGRFSFAHLLLIGLCWSIAAILHHSSSGPLTRTPWLTAPERWLQTLCPTTLHSQRKPGFFILQPKKYIYFYFMGTRNEKGHIFSTCPAIMSGIHLKV